MHSSEPKVFKLLNNFKNIVKKFCNWIQSIYCQSISNFRSIHRSFIDFFFLQNREYCLKRRHRGSRNLKWTTCVISKEEREIAITYLLLYRIGKNASNIHRTETSVDIFCRFWPITNLSKKYNGNRVIPLPTVANRNTVFRIYSSAFFQWMKNGKYRFPYPVRILLFTDVLFLWGKLIVFCIFYLLCKVLSARVNTIHKSSPCVLYYRSISISNS